MPLNLWRDWRRFGAVGVLAPGLLLGGCAAAVVAPVLAATTMIASGDRDSRGKERAAGAEQSDAPKPQLTLVDPAAFTPSRPSQSADGLPVTGQGWQSFVDFTLERSQALKGPEPVPSALLAPEAAIDGEKRLPCRNPLPGVIIDLDQGEGVFTPAKGGQPRPGLAEDLAQLRDAGVVVMWVSAADANAVTAIGEALRNSGLDASGKDPLLLVRNPEERKQVMRTEANKYACVIAIAGDRRSDFDELFDYLRNPDFALELDANLGDGWFIVPPPLVQAPTPAPIN